MTLKTLKILFFVRLHFIVRESVCTCGGVRFHLSARAGLEVIFRASFGYT